MYMKKLTKLHLKSARVLNASEMKRICGGGGSGTKYTYDCQCSQIDVDMANQSGVLPSPTQDVTVEAENVAEAIKKATSGCVGYTQIHCVVI